MKTFMIPLAAISMAGAAPALAQKDDHGRYDGGRYDNGANDNHGNDNGGNGGNDNRRNDRAYISRGELNGDRNRIEQERQDVRDARRYGDKHDVRDEREDVKRAQKEYRQDARDWHRGQNYGWNRPDPRYNGYYADNYYRGGNNYQPRVLNSNDRIYRGRDNRYYCRRTDGTTGLIIGAVGGGVLGNVIAPGGSKTIGSILGGSLGAILGHSIGSGNVTCR